jgi:hypothetical protein
LIFFENETENITIRRKEEPNTRKGEASVFGSLRIALLNKAQSLGVVFR